MQSIVQHFFPIGLIIIAVVAGVGVGIFKVVKSNSIEDPNSFDNLVKNQTVCDELRIAELKNWFLTNRSLAKGNAVFFLAKPCAETSQMFALSHTPSSLDKDHSLLQVVVDEATDLPVAIRLLSFSKLDENLSKNFTKKNYIIIDVK